jgi:hypothetical protein
MRDIIVTARGKGRSVRLRPGDWFELRAKTLGSEISQGGMSKREKGFEETYRFSYDELVHYIGTTSGIVRVRYADDSE